MSIEAAATRMTSFLMAFAQFSVWRNWRKLHYATTDAFFVVGARWILRRCSIDPYVTRGVIITFRVTWENSTWKMLINGRVLKVSFFVACIRPCDISRARHEIPLENFCIFSGISARGLTSFQRRSRCSKLYRSAYWFPSYASRASARGIRQREVNRTPEKNNYIWNLARYIITHNCTCLYTEHKILLLHKYNSSKFFTRM